MMDKFLFMKMKDRNTRNSYLIIAILVVAAILRFNHINQPFVDFISWRQSSNAMMAENFYSKDWNIFYPEINWHGPGPSYNGRELQTITYIAALCYNILGQHEWVGRSIAVLFGLLGIFSLYQLVRKVWDEDRALISAAVMAIMPGSIFIERSFMPDPAMVALVTTSFWMLISYLQTERKIYIVLAAIIGLWGVLTKLPGLIVGLPMLYAVVTYFINQKKPYFNKSITLIVAGVLVTVPVVIYYLWARHLSLTYPPYHFAGSGNWLWDDGLRNWLHNKYFAAKLLWNLQAWIWTISIILLVALGFIFPPTKVELDQNGTAPDSNKNSVKIPWLFHCWFLAFGFYYLIGAKELVLNPWNFHILNPAAAALSGHALFTIFSRWRIIAGLPFASIVLAAFFIIILWFGRKGFELVSKPYAFANHQLGLALKKVSRPKDLVVTIENPLGEPVAIYYSQRRGWVFPPADHDYWCRLPEDDQIAISAFDELRSKGANWFGVVVDRKEDIVHKHAAFFRYVDSTCSLIDKNQQWLIYKIKPASEVAKGTATANK